MCGIVGYFGGGDRKILEMMTNALAYRGPDDVGYYTNEIIGLGHRRLSIIDLSSSARQPMFSSNGTIIVVFNGEIYNFKELRDELQQKGYKFRTKSDTEVIIYSYKEYKEECFNKFNGMFAIAIWDEENKQLILVRDRFGQKPLYYFFDGKNLIFASEIKSLLLHPSVKKDLDETAIRQYFAFDYVPQPRTIFKNIRKLENGQLLVYENNVLKLKYYYKIFQNHIEISRDGAIEVLDNLLRKTVKKHLISDVPTGVFLSGGIDSSTIAYYAKSVKPDLKTFSIGFNESSFDETQYAKQVAKHLQTDHYHKNFSDKELLDIIPNIFSKLDEPFGDASILPTYLLSEFCRSNVRVALSGDGGDELFCGYPNHKVQKFTPNFLCKTKLNQGLVDGLIRLLPHKETNMTLSFKLQRILYASQFDGLYRDFIVVGGFNNSFDHSFKSKLADPLFLFADDFLDSYKNYTYFDKVNLLFQKYYLSDDILFKTDRASMYNSLETRAPFLCTETTDFVNNLPINLKINNLGVSKYILKTLMKGKLPSDIIKRKKKGFGVPMTKWLNRNLKILMLTSLSRKNIQEIGFLNYNVVNGFIDEHLNKKVDNKKILWNLIVFTNWYKKYVL